jgi:predicted RNA binding protein YcfA (HicA-like mRNA interferase family)
MPKLPVLSGREIVSAPSRLGFERIGQRGGHIKPRRGSRTVIVPDHREVRRDTLARILEQSGTSLDEIISGIAGR